MFCAICCLWEINLFGTVAWSIAAKRFQATAVDTTVLALLSLTLLPLFHHSTNCVVEPMLPAES
jgi:hypothetical protein